MQWTETHHRGKIWPLVSIVTAGAFFRFFRLGMHSLWLDEFANFSNASHPFREIHRVILASPPLFHYIVHVFYRVFGKDDFWLRFPSALFGSTAVGFVYLAADRLYKGRAAIWAGLLYAVSPMSIVYSQELRMYSLLPLLALGAIYFWELAMREDRLLHWLWFVAFAVPGLYTHNWFPLLICSQGIWSLGEWIQQKNISRRGVLSFIAVALLYSPWLPMLWDQMHRPIFNHMHLAGYQDLRQTLYAFNGIMVSSGDSWIGVGTDARVFLVIISMGFFVYGGFQNKSTRRLAVVGVLLPILLAFLISKYRQPIYTGDRYPVMCLPAFIIVVSQAFNADVSPRIRRLCNILGIFWIGCCLFAIGKYYFCYQKAPWKTMVQWINATSSPGDSMNFSALDSNVLAFDYYVPKPKPLNDLLSMGSHSSVYMPVSDKNMAAVIRDLPKGVIVKSSKDFLDFSVLVLGRSRGSPGK